MPYRLSTLALAALTICASASAAPRLGLSASSTKTVLARAGVNGATQTIEAFNLGDGNLNLTATASAAWLSATVGAATACTSREGNCLPVRIALNTSALAPGLYTEYITLTDPAAVDSPQDIAVNVNVTGVPSSLSAYVAPSGQPGSTMSLPVFTSGTGIVGTVTTQSGGNWLQFVNGQGGIVNLGVPWFVQVSALNGMAPGTYNGRIVISGSSVSSDNKSIDVTLNGTSSPIVQTSTIVPIRMIAGGGLQYSAFSLYNLGSGKLNITGASSSNKFLTASVTAPDTVLLTADPAGLAPGVYNASVTIQSNAANNAAVSVPVELLVPAAGKPLIFTGGVSNVATGANEAVAQGDIVAIYGLQLAPAGISAVNQGAPPLATTLAGVQVLVNNVPAPLFFVSPGQINFQVPYTLEPGSVAAVQVVSGGSAGNLRPLLIAAAAPRLLYFQSFIQGNYGIIVNGADGSLTLPAGTSVGSFQTHPAKRGDTIVIYGVGFGQTNPTATAGAAAAGTQSVGPADVTFGGGFTGGASLVRAGYAGLTPTLVGLYQVNVTIPEEAPLGSSIGVSVNVGGQQSNTVFLAIGQ